MDSESSSGSLESSWKFVDLGPTLLEDLVREILSHLGPLTLSMVAFASKRNHRLLKKDLLTTFKFAVRAIQFGYFEVFDLVESWLPFRTFSFGECGDILKSRFWGYPVLSSFFYQIFQRTAETRPLPRYVYRENVRKLGAVRGPELLLWLIDLPWFPASTQLVYDSTSGNLDKIKLQLPDYIENREQNEIEEIVSAAIFHSAVSSGNVDLVKYIGSFEPPFYKVDWTSVLDYAIHSGNLEMVRYMLEQKAHPRLSNFIAAGERKNFDMTEVLLQSLDKVGILLSGLEFAIGKIGNLRLINLLETRMEHFGRQFDTSEIVRGLLYGENVQALKKFLELQPGSLEPFKSDYRFALKSEKMAKFLFEEYPIIGKRTFSNLISLSESGPLCSYLLEMITPEDFRVDFTLEDFLEFCLRNGKFYYCRRLLDRFPDHFPKDYFPRYRGGVAYKHVTMAIVRWYLKTFGVPSKNIADFDKVLFELDPDLTIKMVMKDLSTPTRKGSTSSETQEPSLTQS